MSQYKTTKVNVQVRKYNTYEGGCALLYEGIHITILNSLSSFPVPLETKFTKINMQSFFNRNSGSYVIDCLRRRKLLISKKKKSSYGLTWLIHCFVIIFVFCFDARHYSPLFPVLISSQKLHNKYIPHRTI